MENFNMRFIVGGGARKSLVDGALRESTKKARCGVARCVTPVRNPPFPRRFASRTLQPVDNRGYASKSFTTRAGSTPVKR